MLQKIDDIEGKGLELPEDLNLIHTATQGGTAGVRYVRRAARRLVWRILPSCRTER